MTNSLCRPAVCKVQPNNAAFRAVPDISLSGLARSRMWALLQLHAKQCNESDCPVPRCRELRQMRRKQMQRQEEKRRVAFKAMVRQQVRLPCMSCSGPRRIRVSWSGQYGGDLSVLSWDVRRLQAAVKRHHDLSASELTKTQPLIMACVTATSSPISLRTLYHGL